ncbi:hypothetical protein GSI_03926 [Ganoderma sinense ZZ0214-1]|uniref:Uncharacterized protein n=1 Tax=Ganoderma sinense ZZ0214-1 TaxID=1077348 RepID=A0A2G8SKB1_9APHY|nr:hypothetical protein GSI_03926 [Ganoderma sinense ZZ0214-1]
MSWRGQQAMATAGKGVKRLLKCLKPSLPWPRRSRRAPRGRARAPSPRGRCEPARVGKWRGPPLRARRPGCRQARAPGRGRPRLGAPPQQTVLPARRRPPRTTQSD